MPSKKLALPEKEIDAMIREWSRGDASDIDGRAGRPK
jgi:hypothetical protein